MTDEALCNALRYEKWGEAADRIEALTEARDTMGHLWAKEAAAKQVALGRIEELEAKLAKAVEGLHTISGHVVLNNENEEELSESALLARAMLAEIEGKEP